MSDHKPLTRQEVTAAEKLCEAATPGPWDWHSTSELYRLAVPPPKVTPLGFDGPRWLDCVLATKDGGVNEPTDGDAAFIQESRTLLPRALADVRRLRGLLERAPEPCTTKVYYGTPSCALEAMGNCPACAWNAERKQAMAGWEEKT